MFSASCVSYLSQTFSFKNILPHPPSFPLTFQQSQNITLPNRPFNVPNNGPFRFIHKFHPNLRALALGAGSSEDLGYFGVSGGGGFVHFLERFFKKFEKTIDLKIKSIQGKVVI